MYSRTSLRSLPERIIRSVPITMPYEADVAGLAEDATGIHVDEEEAEEDNGEDM